MKTYILTLLIIFNCASCGKDNSFPPSQAVFKSFKNFTRPKIEVKKIFFKGKSIKDQQKRPHPFLRTLYEDSFDNFKKELITYPEITNISSSYILSYEQNFVETTSEDDKLSIIFDIKAESFPNISDIQVALSINNKPIKIFFVKTSNNTTKELKLSLPIKDFLTRYPDKTEKPQIYLDLIDFQYGNKKSYKKTLKEAQKNKYELVIIQNNQIKSHFFSKSTPIKQAILKIDNKATIRQDGMLQNFISEHNNFYYTDFSQKLEKRKYIKLINFYTQNVGDQIQDKKQYIIHSFTQEEIKYKIGKAYKLEASNQEETKIPIFFRENVFYDIKMIEKRKKYSLLQHNHNLFWKKEYEIPDSFTDRFKSRSRKIGCHGVFQQRKLEEDTNNELNFTLSYEDRSLKNDSFSISLTKDYINIKNFNSFSKVKEGYISHNCPSNEKIYHGQKHINPNQSHDALLNEVDVSLEVTERIYPMK